MKFIHRGRYKDLKDNQIMLYAGSEIKFFNTSNNVYYKLIEKENETYIDIGLYVPTYSSNIHCKVETINNGSFVFLADSADANEYTRLNFIGNSLITSCYNSSFIEYISESKKIAFTKGIIKITDIASNTTCYINNTNLYNNDNDIFSVTIDSSDDYSILINIIPKQNKSLLFQHISV